MKDKIELLKKFEEGYGSLFYVNEELKRDEEIIKVAINSKAINLFYVPEDLRTREFCLEACKKDAYAFLGTPVEHIDKDFCLEVTKSNWFSLRYMPKELIDKEICLEAIKNFELAIKLVPEKLKDYEFYLDAYKVNNDVLTLFESELNKNENDTLFLTHLKEAIDNGALDTFKQDNPSYFDGTIQRDIKQEEDFKVNNTSNNGKKVIFVDFDGVLNGRVYAESLFDMKLDDVRISLKKYEDKLKKELTTKFKNNEINKETYIREIRHFFEFNENFVGRIKKRKDLREVDSINPSYISEESIKRLAMICEETGASVVLNGTQARNLLNESASMYYILDDDKTTLLDAMKKYNIPIEVDIAYDYDGGIDTRVDDNKRSGVYTYLRTHPEVESFVVIEDGVVLNNGGHSYKKCSDLYKPFEEVLTYDTFQVDTDEAGLDDKKMKETIAILNTPLEFSLQERIEQVREVYKQDLISSLEDEASDFNKLLKNMNYRDLMDTNIKDAVINRFNIYDCSNNYDIDRLIENPKALLSTLSGINFRDTELNKNLEKEDDKKIHFGED